jgi:hypothetical protein
LAAPGLAFRAFPVENLRGFLGTEPRPLSAATVRRDG